MDITSSTYIYIIPKKNKTTYTLLLNIPNNIPNIIMPCFGFEANLNFPMYVYNN